MIKSRLMGWVCHVATLGYEKRVENFTEKPDGKRSLLKHLGLYYNESQWCYNLNWSPPTQNRGKGQVFFFNSWFPERHLFSIMTSAFRKIGMFYVCVFWITSGVCNDMNFNLNISLFWQVMAAKSGVPVTACCLETSCHIIPNTNINNKEFPELTSRILQF
jgi:hypothetical protein